VTRYISLDISTNTGYAIFDNDKLLDYGVFTRKVKNYKADVKSYKDFPECYPDNFLETIDTITAECMRIIQNNQIDLVIIEHPELGKQRLSQRLLEWTHLTLVRALKNENTPFKYILVSDWRSLVKCYLKYWPEHQTWNKEVRKAKAKATPTKKGNKIPKIDGKRVSATNQKKLSILIANQHYLINVKDNNIADAINIGRAYIEMTS